MAHFTAHVMAHTKKTIYKKKRVINYFSEKSTRKEKMEKDLGRFKKLNFKLIEDMKQTIYNIIAVKETLKDKRINSDVRKELEEDKEKLVKQFTKEFQKNNKEEITKYNEFKDTIN